MDTATTDIYTLSLHALFRSNPTAVTALRDAEGHLKLILWRVPREGGNRFRSEEHTSELQSLRHLVCRLLLEKKKINQGRSYHQPNDSEDERTHHSCPTDSTR